LWTRNAGGHRIQRFEAYNEEEEAEWIARQIEELTGGRGSTLTRRADEEAEALERGERRRHVQDQRSEPGHRRGVLRYGIQLPAGGRNALLPASPRSRTRWLISASSAATPTRSAFERILNRAASRYR